MNATEFAKRLDELLAERFHDALRVDSIGELPTGWELVITGNTALVHQQLVRALDDQALERFLHCWSECDLILSVLGPGERSSTPVLLLSEGKLRLLSGPEPRSFGPEATPAFAEWFQRLIGAPPPMELELVPVGKNLWGTANARGFEVDGFPQELRIPALESYSLVGHAGYGTNSYALYVTRVCGDTRLFLRLPWGGAYMDAEQDRPGLLAGLTEANRLFEVAVRKKLAMCLNNNMDEWYFAAAREVTDRDLLSWGDLRNVQEYVDGASGMGS